MKTLTDVWVVRSGVYSAIFKDKAQAFLELSNPATLERFPDNTVFTVQPGYMSVDYEPPKKDKKRDKKPKGPKLITYIK